MTSWDVLAALGRRWYVAALGVALTGVTLVLLQSQPGVYTVQANVVFLAPGTPGRPTSFDSATSSVIATAGLVERLVNAGDKKAATAGSVTLVSQGVREGHSVELPDSGGQWAHNFDRPHLVVQVTGPTPARVTGALDALVHEIKTRTDTLQTDVRAAGRISTSLSPANPVVRYEDGRRRPALLVAALLGAALTALAAVFVDVHLARPSSRPRRTGAQRHSGVLRT